MRLEKWMNAGFAELEAKNNVLKKAEQIVAKRKEEDAELVEEYENVGKEHPGFPESDPAL